MEAASESSNAYLQVLCQLGAQPLSFIYRGEAYPGKLEAWAAGVEPGMVRFGVRSVITEPPRQHSINSSDFIEYTNSSESQANVVPFDETTRALGHNVMEMYSSLKNEGSLRQAADFRKKIHDLIYEYDVYLAEK
uniref:Uncharacterized protein n=1 Tax=Acrobeloides nanus TaxID=290746 RepID=A0A914E250_9BILA